MKIRNKRILKNGAIAGYVYYPKDKKYKWRIVGRNKKKGGGEEELIQTIKNSGRYDEWVENGSRFGYIDNRPRYFGYNTLNGKQYVSQVDKLYKEKPGRTLVPVFGFINSTKPRRSIKSFGSQFEQSVPNVSQTNSIISSLERVYEKNIISLQELKDLLARSLDDSLLILIGETHDKNTDINTSKQIEIIEAVNNLTRDRVPIYSEMPKRLKNELNTTNNKNFSKLIKMTNMSFIRIQYYLKYLQIPREKNYIIPSNVTVNNRTRGSCNPEYAEDIKRVCEENKLVIGIMGLSHIKCIKDYLNETVLDNGSKLKVITILSDDLNDILELATKCMTIKFNITNTRSAYKTICEIIDDSLLLDIPDSKKKGKKIYLEILKQLEERRHPQLVQIPELSEIIASRESKEHKPPYHERRPKNIQRNLRKKGKQKYRKKIKYRGR